MKTKNILLTPMGEGRIRIVTHLDYTNEMHEILLLIAKKERKLIETEGNESVTIERISQISQKLNSSIDSVLLLERVWNVKSQLFVLLSKKLFVLIGVVIPDMISTPSKIYFLYL